MPDYRTRIYQNYASSMQDASMTFNEAEALRWGIAYDTYLKGWLPANKDVSILELACGWGKLLHFLKSRGYKNLKGIDVSPQQVAIARQVSENVVEAEAIDYLETHKEEYDLIVGLDIIEHFEKDDVLTFLDACYSALRPGGRLILQTPNAESPWGTHHRYNDITHEICFNPNALKRLLELVGFSGITSHETGPVVKGLPSLGRYIIWKIIWSILAIWNLAETGTIGDGIYTRVFLTTALKNSDK